MSWQNAQPHSDSGPDDHQSDKKCDMEAREGLRGVGDLIVDEAPPYKKSLVEGDPPEVNTGFMDHPSEENMILKNSTAQAGCKKYTEDLIQNIDEIEDCVDCRKVVENILNDSCDECGPPSKIEDLQMCHLGLDVVALFPSMQERNTGLIIRNRTIQSSLKMPSFDTKEGGRYVIMNQNLTGPLGKLRRVLPTRRHNRGVMPGMTNADLNSKVGNIDAQWKFPSAKITEPERKEIIGRCAEIAVRTLFRNFCYTFGGKLYRQKSGGPIGLRITMACSRLVMMDWGEKYENILLTADLQISLPDLIKLHEP